MIWILRNISVHLWIATLFTIPLTFYIMPGLTRFFPGINPLTTGLVTITGIIVVIGFLMDATAKKAVMNLIKEGQAWERSGILNKAEESYIKALRVYDTFLLWPFSAKKTAQEIAGAIAKFKLNTSIENQNFKLGTAVYLKMNPMDEDIVQLWLGQLRRSTIVTSFEQEVLSVLAEKHYTNKHLSALMIDIFLGLERTDFSATKLYQHVQKDPVFENKYAKKIDSLIGKPEKTIQQEAFFLQPQKKPGRKIEIKKKIQAMAQKTAFFLKRSWACIGSGLSFLILSAGKVAAYIKEHEKARFYLKVGFLGIISAWFLFFMITTLSHMSKFRAAEKERVKIEIQTPKPFSIQVAAYLKQKHADRYVDILKKKGIDAMTKKVNGGGKTWFVVRVSEFADKKSAADYGRKLKRQKIIDDFFVNNK